VPNGDEVRASILILDAGLTAIARNMAPSFCPDTDSIFKETSYTVYKRASTQPVTQASWLSLLGVAEILFRFRLAAYLGPR
jgi:hypothetical protein